MLSDGDQCQSNPCKHGGTCRDGIGGYTCTCAEMYSGTNCQTGECDIYISESDKTFDVRYAVFGTFSVFEGHMSDAS